MLRAVFDTPNNQNGTEDAAKSVHRVSNAQANDKGEAQTSNNIASSIEDSESSRTPNGDALTRQNDTPEQKVKSEDVTEQTLDASHINAEFYNIYAKSLIYLGDAQEDENSKSQFYQEAKDRLHKAFATFSQNPEESKQKVTKTREMSSQIIDETMLNDIQKETLIDSNLTLAKALTREVIASLACQAVELTN